jgi:hypothetical protein
VDSRILLGKYYSLLINLVYLNTIQQDMLSIQLSLYLVGIYLPNKLLVQSFQYQRTHNQLDNQPD